MERTLSGGVRVRALARRSLGRGRGSREPTPLVVPLGAKLELTHRCNLRCGFCYTDSPRRTLERPSELTDAEWSGVIDQVVEIGVLEAVVTGGEPLLRPGLTLSIVQRLAGAGVSTMLNTNGWYVDEQIADRLALVPGLRTHISLDGACAATHDASRGAVGGWRRAIRAIDLLASRGVDVVVVHVLIPGGEKQVQPLLRQMWALGASAVRLSPIVDQGAARGRSWSSDMSAVRAAIEDVSLSPMRVELLPEDTAEFDRPRSAFLVRPNGDVVPDSRRPFVYGHAIDDTLAISWERLAAAGGVAEAPAGHNPYGDVDLRLDGRESERRPTGEAAEAIDNKVLRGREKAPADPPNLTRAEEIVEQLVLARRHRLGDVRRSRTSSQGEHVRVLATKHVHRLNPTASAILGSGAVRSLREVVVDFEARHPEVDRAAIQRDVLAAVRDLQARGIIQPVPSSCA